MNHPKRSNSVRGVSTTGLVVAVAASVLLAGCTEYEDDPTREEPSSPPAGTPAFTDPTPGSTSARTTKQAYDRLEQRIADYQQKVIEEAEK
ncbi:MAG: hypothetical protein ACO3Y3_11780 [Phycisphaerales bacterium]